MPEPKTTCYAQVSEFETCPQQATEYWLGYWYCEKHFQEAARRFNSLPDHGHRPRLKTTQEEK